ncbi:MAG: hypothetical protein ACI4A8_00905, partial [Muribaculaceae bacterium]
IIMRLVIRGVSVYDIPRKQEALRTEKRGVFHMYLINYHLYANTANLPKILAEDTAAAELRHPVQSLLTRYHGEITTHFRKKADASHVCEAGRTLCGQKPRAVGSV